MYGIPVNKWYDLKRAGVSIATKRVVCLIGDCQSVLPLGKWVSTYNVWATDQWRRAVRTAFMAGCNHIWVKNTYQFLHYLQWQQPHTRRLFQVPISFFVAPPNVTWEQEINKHVSDSWKSIRWLIQIFLLYSIRFAMSRKVWGMGGERGAQLWMRLLMQWFKPVVTDLFLRAHCTIWTQFTPRSLYLWENSWPRARDESRLEIAVSWGRVQSVLHANGPQLGNMIQWWVQDAATWDPVRKKAMRWRMLSLSDERTGCFRRWYLCFV